MPLPTRRSEPLPPKAEFTTTRVAKQFSKLTQSGGRGQPDPFNFTCSSKVVVIAFRHAMVFCSWMPPLKEASNGELQPMR